VYDVLHPGQPPTGGPDHERGAPHQRHDAGPLVDAERGDFGRQHSRPEVNTEIDRSIDIDIFIDLSLYIYTHTHRVYRGYSRPKSVIL